MCVLRSHAQVAPCTHPSKGTTTPCIDSHSHYSRCIPLSLPPTSPSLSLSLFLFLFLSLPQQHPFNSGHVESPSGTPNCVVTPSEIVRSSLRPRLIPTNVIFFRAHREATPDLSSHESVLKFLGSLGFWSMSERRAMSSSYLGPYATLGSVFLKGS